MIIDEAFGTRPKPRGSNLYDCGDHPVVHVSHSVASPFALGADALPVWANRRKRAIRKTISGENGTIENEMPRDREGSFAAKRNVNGQTRIDGLDERIIAIWARSMSVRDIRGDLEEL